MLPLNGIVKIRFIAHLLVQHGDIIVGETPAAHESHQPCKGRGGKPGERILHLFAYVKLDQVSAVE
ncbi:MULTISPECIES: hypothetical protein [Serratia]|uniref:hypothetical protein n=1 Tax=Serratia TaxID=613 RepID=UPI0038C9FAF5